MILIIAEKKMAAYAYAKALSGVYDEYKGYLVGKNQLVYTWAQGYLFQYKEPGDIDSKWLKWNWEQLPIILEDIPLEPIPNQIKQIEIIKMLCSKSTMIINGTDAAAAGEEIFRQIIDYLNIKNKPIKRLWTSSLQHSAIKKAYNSLMDHAELDNLAKSAYTRSKLDYLLGINTTRCLTLSSNGETLPMGRLIASVLALVKRREMEQQEFKEESYFAITSMFKYNDSFIEANYAGPRLTEKDELKALEALMDKEQPILEYEDKLKEVFPPLLPNHTAVLVTMFQRYKMKPFETNKVLETLYLKGLISYPRTSSCYVTEHDIPAMKEAFSILRIFYPNLSKGSDIARLNTGNKRIVNETSDHHAIIPTSEIQQLENELERNVYQFILERFMLQAQVPAKLKIRKLTLKYKDNKTVFTSSERITLEAGWKGLELNFSHDELEEGPDEENNVVPSFKELEQNKPYQHVEHTVTTKKTSPPSSYTEGSLIKQMENISTVLSNEEYKKILKKVGLGTSATRAETVKKLQDINYLALNKSKLVVTELGQRALNLLNQDPLTNYICSVEMTAEWERSLEVIRDGGSPVPLKNKTLEYIHQFINCLNGTDREPPATIIKEDDIKCTRCQNGKIIKTPKTYKCNSCDFFIWSKQYNKEISLHMLKDILTKGNSALLSFTNKDEKKYKARLKLSDKPGKLQLIFNE